MTKIEFFKAVAANEITSEVIAMAEALVAKDAEDKAKQKIKRAEKASSRQADANIEIAFGLLTSTPITGSELLAKAEGAGMKRAEDKALTPQYMATLMRPLVADGRVVKTEIKVNGKKAKVVAYAVVA